MANPDMTDTPANSPADTNAEVRTESPADTRTSLLDAAERLFAAEGVDRASLRSITQGADANLAAVNYHFGSKEGLIREVLSRRLEPLNRRRLEMLDEVEHEHPDRPPLRAVLRAFLEPAIQMVEHERGGHEFARFVCRTFSEPDEKFREIVFDQFTDVAKRFGSAFRTALPDLPAEDVHWRFHFMIGSMVHTAGLGFLAHRMSNGLCNPTDADGVVEHLLNFLEGGFSARPASPAEGSS